MLWRNVINIVNNVILGANAFVTKDIPDNSISVGIPAKVIAKHLKRTNGKVLLSLSISHELYK